MLEKNMDSMSAKQIRGALGLKNSATAKIKAELQKMIREGKIDKQGNRYFLAMEKDAAKDISILFKSKRKRKTNLSFSCFIKKRCIRKTFKSFYWKRK